MYKLLAFSAFTAACFAQSATFLDGIKPPAVSTLPTASTKSGRIYQFTAGAHASDCLTGGGSTTVNCWSNGTIWIPLAMSALSAATDLQAVLSSGTLTIGGSCAASAPCIAAIGNQVFSITTPAIPVPTAGTGTVYNYVDSSGAIIVGHNGITFSGCTGCTTASGITAFPEASFPLWTWTVSSGAWVVGGGTQYRSSMSRTPAPAAGSCITVTPGAQATVAVTTGCASKIYSGAGTPGTVSGSRRGDVYVDTTAHSIYWCDNASSDCASVAAGNWIIFGGTVVNQYVTTGRCNFGTAYVGANWGSRAADGPNPGCDSTGEGILWLGFSNSATNYAYFNIQLPAAWTTANALTVVLGLQQINTGTGDVKLKVATYCPATLGGITGSYNADQASTTAAFTGSATSYQVSVSSLTTTGCSGGSTLSIRISRDNTIGSNYADAAPVVGAWIHN